MRTELKRAFSSPGFWATMIVMFLCLQGFALPVHVGQSYGPTAEAIEYRQSALALTLGGIFFGGVILLLPFCASLAYSGSQVDDIRTDTISLCLIRSSVRNYAVHKVAASFLSAFVAILVAFIAHAAIWHVLGIPYDPIVYPYQEISFWSESYFSKWATIGNGWPIILNIAVGMAFSAGCWSIVALAVAIWVPDKMLVCIIPACIEKLWRSNLAYYLFGIWLPDPDTLFNDAQTLSGNLECLLAYAVLVAIALLMYILGLKRRAKNA